MSGERSLPEGWIVRESKSYPGKVYYFNTDTGTSIWEHPKLLNSGVLTENKFKLAKNKNDEFRLPDFDYKNDPRIDFLEKRVYERLTKTVNNSGKPVNKKSSDIPTAVVTPVLSGKEIVSNTPLSNYRNLALSKQDPRLFRQNITPISRAVNCVCENSGVNLVSTPQNRNLSVRHRTLSELCSNVDDSEMSSLESDSNESVGLQVSDFSNSELEKDTDIESSPTEESSNDELPPQLSLNSTSVNTPGEKSNKIIHYYFVVDTNVLLGNLRLVKKVFNSSVGKNDVPHLFIPWIVIQEIDNILRRHSKEHKLYQMAKMCSKFLNNMLRIKEPRFHCQTVKEVQDWAKDYSECNDDRLLECCLSLTEKMPQAKVILVTNDVHLDTKAHIFGLPIFSIKELVSKLNFIGNIPRASILHKSFKSAKVNHTPESFKRVEKKVLMNRKWKAFRSLPGKTTERKEKSRILSEAFLELSRVLHPFVVAQLQKVHGDKWKSLNLNLSNMKSILSIIVQHWDSMFASNYSSKVRRNFILLQTNFKSSHSQFKRNDYLNTLTAIEDIFCDIKRKCPSLDVNIENIQDMRVACIEQFSKCNTDVSFEDSNVHLEHSIVKGVSLENVNDTLERIDVDISSESNEALANEDVDQKAKSDVVSRVFEHNWTVIHQLCGMISDFYGVPHGLDYKKPESLPPRSKFECMVQKLCPAVNDIKSFLSKIIETESTSTELDYEKFASVMINFVPSLDIVIESVDSSHFNAASLAEFCQSTKNLGVLSGGYKQLEIYFSKLGKALTAMALKRNSSN